MPKQPLSRFFLVNECGQLTEQSTLNSVITLP